MRSTLPTFNEVWQQQFRAGFLSQLEQFSAQQSFLIGCSGGMDSMLLLYLMSVLCPERIRAIYINHQLQVLNQAWGEFVQTQAHQLNIPCIVETVEVAAGNLEQQARQARYAAYQKHLQPNDILVLAHHQQDQAETLLMRLFSGAGVTGLSAMKVLDTREDFIIWRPLLEISREQIEAWVKSLDIPYVQDPTNHDVHYDRAWCRAELWPMLRQRFPKMQQALVRTSHLMQDADLILAEIATQDLTNCGNAQKLDLTAVQALSEARQRQLLSIWMKGNEIYRPSLQMVQRLKYEVIEAKADAQAALHCNGYYYVRYQQQLFRLTQEEYLAQQHIPAQQKLCLKMHDRLKLAAGSFHIQAGECIGLSSELLQQELILSPRLGGEKLHLYGRVGSWPLKKAIQEAKIYPWQRHTIQILSIDNVMLGVFTPQGFWLAHSSFCQKDGWLPNLVSEIISI